jgi:hypothetical protein
MVRKKCRAGIAHRPHYPCFSLSGRKNRGAGVLARRGHKLMVRKTHPTEDFEL